MYNIIYKRLVLWLLGEELSQPKTVAFANALIKPIVDIYERFISLRAEHLKRLYYNSQVVYLEAALNDKFDRANKAIRILDPTRVNKIYLYARAEDKPLYLGTKYIPSRLSQVGGGSDFIIQMPRRLEGAFSKNEILGFTSLYKLASKRPQIVYI